MLVLDAFPAISEDFNAHAMGGALRDDTKTAARETSDCSSRLVAGTAMISLYWQN